MFPHWIALVLLFASAILVFAAMNGQVYAQDKPKYPEGRIVSLDYETDRGLYPGTARNIKVYIPQQYASKTPACLYIGLDGIMCNAPKVFDKLIAEEKMPVTIGIFVQPGVIRGKDGNVIRYNRSNEFDFTDGRFAEFLETEIIPFVEKEAEVSISKDPNDRSIFGLSSGGIAAFNAAWQRPDLFRRVFSGVGTFVSMRGGNDLQMFVRKCEPKPLRIFLQDGSNDVWNATFGHWYEANQMLSTALDFAGYDTKYDWSDGYHSVKRSAEIFEDVMVWLWRDYPEPIKAGITQNDFLNQYLYRDGKSEPYGKLSDDTKDKWEVKNIEMDIKGALLPGTKGGDPSSSSYIRVTRDINPEQDYVFGIVYFVNYPDYSFAVYSFLPDYGFGTNWEDSFSNCLWQVCNSGYGNYGYGENAQRFYWLHSTGNKLLFKGPMAFDSRGNLFVLTNIGIQVCDQNGRVRFILDIPEDLKYELNLWIAIQHSSTKSAHRPINAVWNFAGGRVLPDVIMPDTWPRAERFWMKIEEDQIIIFEKC